MKQWEGTRGVVVEGFENEVDQVGARVLAHNCLELIENARLLQNLMALPSYVIKEVQGRR